MTQNEIIEMARQAGIPDWEIVSMKGELKAFAKLVAAKATASEREACAKVCEQMNSIDDYYGERIELICAEAIRARTGDKND